MSTAKTANSWALQWHVHAADQVAVIDIGQGHGCRSRALLIGQGRSSTAKLHEFTELTQLPRSASYTVPSAQDIACWSDEQVAEANEGRTTRANVTQTAGRALSDAFAIPGFIRLLL